MMSGNDSAASRSPSEATSRAPHDARSAHSPVRPLGLGLGLRTPHYAHILEHWPTLDWFEIVSENFLYTEGRPLFLLDQIAERYPICLHGVSLSIGGTAPLDRDYLARLRALRRRTKAAVVSDHLCFTGIAGKNTHDLLPLPYTDEALRHVAERVRQVQDILGCQIALENPSSYLSFSASTHDEAAFLAEVAERADCLLLLDVNNVFVTAHNHGLSADAYLRTLPMDRVAYLHVAGHTDCGTHIADTHIGPVIDGVWALLDRARELGAPRSVLLEWDAEIPPFEVVAADLARAEIRR
jgi:uncharacterized protein